VHPRKRKEHTQEERPEGTHRHRDGRRRRRRQLRHRHRRGRHDRHEPYHPDALDHRALKSTRRGPEPVALWGGQRSDETPLTGDALAKVTAIAKSQVSGSTVVRVETDADRHAKYEAHILSRARARETFS